MIVVALAFLASIPYWIGEPAAPVPSPVVATPLPTLPVVVIKETEVVTVEVEVERLVEVPVEVPVMVPITPTVVSVPKLMEVPVLLLPQDGSTTRNPVRFEWEGRLRPSQRYRVTAYQLDGAAGEQSPLLTATGWEVTFDGETYGGWQWVVTVLDGERVVAISDVGQFWFDPFADTVGEE